MNSEDSRGKPVCLPVKLVVMQFESKQLLRMYVGEQAKHHHRPFYEAVVAEAKATGIAGATVFKGILSYGMSGRVHTAKILELSQHLPMLVEIVDTPERVSEFLPVVKALAGESGVHVHVTLEEVQAGVIGTEQ